MCIKRDTFYDALGASGSDVTIQFVADVIGRPEIDSRVKQRLTSALGFIQTPSEEAVQIITVSEPWRGDVCMST